MGYPAYPHLCSPATLNCRQINDIGFQAVRDPDSGEVLFNIEVGGSC